MAARTALTCREYANTKKLLFVARRVPSRHASAQAAPSTSSAEKIVSGDVPTDGSGKQTIVIPKRIPRGPTDILKALASTVQRDFTAPHYKYHDDPFFIPGELAVSQDVLQSFLELLCFYNCKQPLDEDLTEERWQRQMAPRETRKSWKDGGLAEQVFDSIENKDGRAYAALIQGMAKHYHVDKAYELFHGNDFKRE
ncbi:hypothetical protein MTO96_049632 [Rhipicephalus appendiculatus]